MPKPPQILCINPWIYDFTAYDLWSKPLGLLYIAAILRQQGCHVSFLDCLDKWNPQLLARQKIPSPKIDDYGTGHFHREIVEKPQCLHFMPRYFARYGLPEDIFINELKAVPQPDAILITSIMTYWYMGPKRVIELCRQIYPNVPVILGGIYATLMPRHAQTCLKPDYVIIGEGEYKVAQLLSDLLNFPQLTEDLPANFDDAPYPALDLLRKNDYYPLLTSKGCPFKCSFCATNRLSPHFVQRNPQKVVDEILTQTAKYNVKDVAFYDDALLFNPNHHIKVILQEIINSGRPLRFHTPNGLHGRYIDEELASLMYKAGFKTVRVSLESVSPQRLTAINSKIDRDAFAKAIEYFYKAGFNKGDIETYVIMGLPNQPMEEVVETINYASSIGVKVRLTSFSPIPGTKDHEKAVQQGLFPKDADPLLTNKTIIPLYRTTEDYYRYHTLRQLTQKLNAGNIGI